MTDLKARMSLVMKYMHVKNYRWCDQACWEASHPSLFYKPTQNTMILLCWWLLINYSILLVDKSIHVVIDIENLSLNIEVWWCCKCEQKYISQRTFWYAYILYKEKNEGFRRKTVSLSNLGIHNNIFFSKAKVVASSFVFPHILKVQSISHCVDKLWNNFENIFLIKWEALKLPLLTASSLAVTSI